MQSRFDHLIHKHAHRGSRPTVPRVAQAAAAIVAAVLFLLTLSTTQAHDPADTEPSGGAICSDLLTGALNVGAVRSERTAFVGDDCQFSVVVSPPATQGDIPTSCNVMYTPTAGRDAVEVAYRFVGECNGVVVRSEISFSDAEGDALAASSGSSKWALSKLIGHDVAHIPMFWHYSRVEWTYNGSTIASARQTVDRFTNDWWHRHSENSSKGTNMNAINTIYDAWDDAEWHSDGFPFKINRDVLAESKVTARVRTGVHTCYFEFEWVSGAGWYPNLHKHTYCQSGS